MNGLQRQSDIERLTAWMDGELPEAEARQVERRVAGEAPWRASWEEFRRVDAALLLAAAPPRPSPDLADRIVRRCRRGHAIERVLRRAGALAAAAILLGLWLGNRTPPAPSPRVPAIVAQIADILKVPTEDALLVGNLRMFENYDEMAEYQQIADVADVQTLSALAKLEGG